MKLFFLAIFLVMPVASLALDSVDQRAIQDGNRFVEQRPAMKYQGTQADYIRAWENSMGVADLLYLKNENILEKSSVTLSKINEHLLFMESLPEQTLAFDEYQGTQRDAEMLRQMALLFARSAKSYTQGKTSYADFKTVKFFVESEGQYLAEKLRGKEYECKDPDSEATRLWEMSDC